MEQLAFDFPERPAKGFMTEALSKAVHWLTENEISDQERLIFWPKELPVPFFVGESGQRKIARWSLPPENFV